MFPNVGEFGLDVDNVGNCLDPPSHCGGQSFTPGLHNSASIVWSPSLAFRNISRINTSRRWNKCNILLVGGATKCIKMSHNASFCVWAPCVGFTSGSNYLRLLLIFSSNF